MTFAPADAARRSSSSSARQHLSPTRPRLQSSRLISSLLCCAACVVASSSVPSVSAVDDDNGGGTTADAAVLRRMDFDIGYGPETFEAYVQPDVSTFYYGEDDPGTRRGAAMGHKHGGLAGKFVNMSPDRVRLYWDPADGSPGVSHAVMGPFQAVGTSTFPSHKFYMTPTDDPDTKLMIIHIEKGRSNYYYDPLDVPTDARLTLENLSRLTFEEYQRYERQRRNRLFDEEYKQFTGRDYLALYPRAKPRHYLWEAEYFGQEHTVSTRETHFIAMPPPSVLGKIRTVGRARALADDAPRLLAQYRENNNPNPEHEQRGDDDESTATMNLTLKVLSCAPRAFEIRNFLSDVEVEHILRLATGMDLGRSSTSSGEDEGGDEERDDDSGTRTSFNTWVPREESPIIDAIYRRAADLLRVDEALFRSRGDGEFPDFGNDKTIAESLQLVHYDVAQEYTAHHDFGFGDINAQVHEERYATLLLYLNEGMEGGETSFPKWENAETEDGLDVVPEMGKAVLFYSQLPDGNMDDLSIHAARPVTNGEKWLMNLWVHDPHYDE